MLQTLLEDRFALKVHNMTQTADADAPMGDVLALVVDRSDGTLGPPRRARQNGPPSEGDDPAVPYCPTGYRAGEIRVDGATMFTVAELLSLPPARALLGTITEDGTRLADRYTMELGYPFAPSGPGAPAAPPEFAGRSLSTAVREQWGLRLVPSKGAAPLPLRIMASLPRA